MLPRYDYGFLETSAAPQKTVRCEPEKVVPIISLPTIGAVTIGIGFWGHSNIQIKMNPRNSIGNYCLGPYSTSSLDRIASIWGEPNRVPLSTQQRLRVSLR